MALPWLALLAWALASATWSWAPFQSATKALYGLLHVILILVLASTANLHQTQALKSAARFCLFAALIGLLINTIEIFTGQIIYRSWAQWIEGIDQSTKHLTVADGIVTRAGDATSNRRILVATMMLSPTLMLSAALLPRRYSLPIGVFLFVSAVGILFGTHESSKLAIVSGSIVAAGCAISAIWTRRIVLAGWVCATLLVLPIVTTMYELGAQKSAWLFASAKHRVLIWNFMADSTYKSLPLGIGADATETVQTHLIQAGTEQKRTEREIGSAAANHPHNAYLQVWYELGIVGACIFSIAGILLVRKLSVMPDEDQLLPLTQFAIVACMIFSSYNMWQPWLMATISLSVSMTLLAMKLKRPIGLRSRSEPGDGF